MTILDQRPGYRLWLDGGKMYNRRDGKTREVVGIAKEMLLAMYAAEGCSDAK